MKYKIERFINQACYDYLGETYYRYAIVDKNGVNITDRVFADENSAFDYLMTEIIQDEEYKNCKDNPADNIQVMFDRLHDVHKKSVLDILFQKYKIKRMDEYFSEQEEDEDEKGGLTILDYKDVKVDEEENTVTFLDVKLLDNLSGEEKDVKSFRIVNPTIFCGDKDGE